MQSVMELQHEFTTKGYAIIEEVFSPAETATLLNIIETADTSGPAFRKTNELFAIRQFLKEVPGIVPFVFNNKLCRLIEALFGTTYFVVKSIYFNKPGQSNWFVAYHQDLTIAVDKKIEWEGFGPWTVKQNQFAVQPPRNILEDNFTIRLHLDDTDEQNGALRIIPGSHNKGIYRPETIDRTTATEVCCTVKKGGIMLMRPLLLHASSRTTNNCKRRVIHIEFSSQLLPGGLQWAERLPINTVV